MNGTQDLNLNSTQCLVTVMDFGSRTVTNICTGAVHTVPWGSVDWVLAIGKCGALATIIGACGALAYSILQDC